MNRPLYPSGPCARTEPSRHHPRHDWTETEAREIHDLPFPELLFHAQKVHRRHFDRAEIETATPLSIKSRRLRLLLAKRQVEYRRRREQVDAGRKCAGGGTARRPAAPRGGAAVDRTQPMSDETQALCFIAGANSIFTGNVLLTTGNPDRGKDDLLLKGLGMRMVGPRHRSNQARS